MSGRWGAPFLMVSEVCPKSTGLGARNPGLPTGLPTVPFVFAIRNMAETIYSNLQKSTGETVLAHAFSTAPTTLRYN